MRSNYKNGDGYIWPLKLTFFPSAFSYFIIFKVNIRFSLDILRDNGIRGVAIDLPGFGKSKNVPKPADVISYLDGWFPTEKFIILSPSMSGSYAIPYIMKKPDRLDAVFYNTYLLL